METSTQQGKKITIRMFSEMDRKVATAQFSDPTWVDFSGYLAPRPRPFVQSSVQQIFRSVSGTRDTVVGTDRMMDKINLGIVPLNFTYPLPCIYYFCAEDKGLVLAIILITKPCTVY